LRSEPSRIQLCGKLVVDVEGRRYEDALPGRQGRLLFGYLAIHRRRGVARDELVGALWPEHAPPAADRDLRVVVSRLRRALGDQVLVGRGSLKLALPPWTWIDIEAADAAIHRAESAVQRHQWHEGWAPAHIALNISRRTFLEGSEASWIDEIRRHLEDIRLRALECWAAVGLGIGGPELADAQTAARKLTEEALLRERGYVLLMRVLDARGETAEAIRVYEQLRQRLDDNLGITPGPGAREMHARILLRASEPADR
jgi:DNA-binding SARP family transcriptional activator